MPYQPVLCLSTTCSFLLEAVLPLVHVDLREPTTHAFSTSGANFTSAPPVAYRLGINEHENVDIVLICPRCGASLNYMGVAIHV